MQLPYERVYVNTGDPIEENNLIEFRLLYEGQLLPSGNESRPEEKHAIRRIFHPQLRRLWQIKPNLQHLARRGFLESELKDERLAADVTEAIKEDINPPPEAMLRRHFDWGIEAMGKRWARAGYDLVPLVTPALALQCSLEILLLRPDERRFVFEQGDIDGQVRTLLDALRIPDNTGETGRATPTEDEKPLFCLLQDDRLISEIKVTADQLLTLPEQRGNLNAHQEAIARINLLLYNDGKHDLKEEDKRALATAREILQIRGEVKPNDAFVVIHVRLNHREPRTWDNYFG